MGNRDIWKARAAPCDSKRRAALQAPDADEKRRDFDTGDGIGSEMQKGPERFRPGPSGLKMPLELYRAVWNCSTTALTRSLIGRRDSLTEPDTVSDQRFISAR